MTQVELGDSRDEISSIVSCGVKDAVLACVVRYNP